MQHVGIACGMFIRRGGGKMGGKSSLKCYYKLAKEEFGQESYVMGFGSMEKVRLRFRLGYQQDSWRTKRDVVCVRLIDVRYVMKVLWKMVLCSSCCTVGHLLVIE